MEKRIKKFEQFCDTPEVSAKSEFIDYLQCFDKKALSSFKDSYSDYEFKQTLSVYAQKLLNIYCSKMCVSPEKGIEELGYLIDDMIN